MKKIILAAVLSLTLVLLLVPSLHTASGTVQKVVLENVRVEVVERIIPPGGVREPHIRPADQVIVFLNDAIYERVDPETGETTIRKRKAGEVIWHSRGEKAPKLINAGKTPFRSLIIALK